MSGYFDTHMGQWYPIEPKVVCECAYCGEDLHEGEEVVEYDGELYCDEMCLMSNALTIIDWSKVTLKTERGK